MSGAFKQSSGSKQFKSSMRARCQAHGRPPGNGAYLAPDNAGAHRFSHPERGCPVSSRDGAGLERPEIGRAVSDGRHSIRQWSASLAAKCSEELAPVMGAG